MTLALFIPGSVYLNALIVSTYLLSVLAQRSRILEVEKNRQVVPRLIFGAFLANEQTNGKRDRNTSGQFPPKSLGKISQFLRYSRTKELSACVSYITFSSRKFSFLFFLEFSANAAKQFLVTSIARG